MTQPKQKKNEMPSTAEQVRSTAILQDTDSLPDLKELDTSDNESNSDAGEAKEVDVNTRPAPLRDQSSLLQSHQEDGDDGHLFTDEYIEHVNASFKEEVRHAASNSFTILSDNVGRGVWGVNSHLFFTTLHHESQEEEENRM